VCVIVSSARITLYTKNSKVEKSEQERKNGDGCMNKRNGVSCNHSFNICTPLKMAMGGILVPYAFMRLVYGWVQDCGGDQGWGLWAIRKQEAQHLSGKICDSLSG
jgi:hypothetical protein